MLPLSVPLFVPADRPQLFAKAAAAGADAVILDLEDAVSDDRKAEARAQVKAAPDLGLPVVVRCNPPASRHFAEDMAALRDSRFDAVMLPKYEMRADAEAVLRLVGREVPIIALVETAAGLLNAFVAHSLKGASQAAFGSLDFAADIRCRHEFEELRCARSLLVLAARAAGLPAPLDGVTLDIRDPQAVARDAAAARQLGFGGKLCVHPAQIAPARAAFRPSPEELAWAQRIVAAAASGGVSNVDGTMVDAPVLARARQILR